MLLLELLGIPGSAAPGRSKYHRTGKANGRPSEMKIYPRPKKNLWFHDQNLWGRDLQHTHTNNFDFVSSEDEETVIACDKDRRMAYGRWNKKDGKGITFHTPRPLHTVIHPKTTLKDFIAKD